MKIKKRLEIFIDCPTSFGATSPSRMIKHQKNTTLPETAVRIVGKARAELIKERLLKKLRERGSIAKYYNFPESVEHTSPTFKSNVLAKIIERRNHKEVIQPGSLFVRGSYSKTPKSIRPKLKSLIDGRIRIMLPHLQRDYMKSYTPRVQSILKRNEHIELQRSELPFTKRVRPISMLKLSFKDSRQNAKENKLRLYKLYHSYFENILLRQSLLLTLRKQLRLNSTIIKTSPKKEDFWSFPFITPFK